MNAKQFVEKVARMKPGRNQELNDLIGLANSIVREGQETKGLTGEAKKQLQDAKKALASIGVCARVMADAREPEHVREAVALHHLRLQLASADPMKLKLIFRRREAQSAVLALPVKPAASTEPLMEQAA